MSYLTEVNASRPDWRTPEGCAQITAWLTEAGHDMSLVWHVELEGRIAKVWRCGQPGVVVPLPASCIALTHVQPTSIPRRVK
jgi:hypothetical protein